jgi:transposase
MDTRLLAADRFALVELIHQLEEQVAKLGADNAQLQAENAQLRAQIAALEVQRDAGKLPRGPAAPSAIKANRPQRAKEQPRKKRVRGFARRRAEATQRVEHAVANCPACGCGLQGGSVKRTRQVWHIPLVPVQVIEHAFIERRCPRCGQRHVPKPREVLKDVLGRHRLSISTMSLVASLRAVGRMPVETICWYLQTYHGLSLSVGAVVDVLRAVARRAQGTMSGLLQELRNSPVVHGDETTWREDGQNGYMWVFSTPMVRYFLHRFSRSGAIVPEVLGEDFAGTLVSDFYGGYNRMLGQHQRCWAHLLRDVHELKEKWPEAPLVHTWAEQVHSVYQRAKEYSAAHPQASRGERLKAQRDYEHELLALATPYLHEDCPQRVLCQRMEHFLPELFTFVADPRVPADNNAAERSIRPLAVSRKISGGTRSEPGTNTQSTLATLFGTWLLRGQNPFMACQQLLTSP